MVKRTVKLPKELDARLALRKRLRKDDSVNMLEALKEFAGCIEGPPDLSTNKAYFDDFGLDAKE